MATERKTLREWRAVRRLSRRALADAADLSEFTIESIEQWRHPPRYESMRRIADALGVSVDAVDWEAGKRERDERDAKTLAPVA